VYGGGGGGGDDSLRQEVWMKTYRENSLSDKNDSTRSFSLPPKPKRTASENSLKWLHVAPFVASGDPRSKNQTGNYRELDALRRYLTSYETVSRETTNLNSCRGESRDTEPDTHVCCTKTNQPLWKRCS
jgi:hypothetical protein